MLELPNVGHTSTQKLSINMQFIGVLLDIAKLADFRWKNADRSNIQWKCHVIHLFFASSLYEV